MDEQELRAAAARAIEAGADPAAVNARLEEMLRETQGSRAQAAAAEVEAAADPRAGSSLSPLVGGTADFLRMMGQTLSGEWGDELLGDKEYVGAIRDQNPGAALAGQVAGGVVPIPAVTRAGVGGGAAIGAGAGVAAAVGANEGSFLERLAQGNVPVSGAIGAGVGALAPALSTLGRNRNVRQNIAEGLERTSGVKRSDRAAMFEDVRGMRRRAKQGYAQAEASAPTVMDEGVTDIIEAFRDMPSGRASRAANRIADPDAPTVPELQTFRRELRKEGYKDDIAEVTQALNMIPGFREADDLYAQAGAAQRAFADGRKAGQLSARVSADDINEMTRGLSDADAFIFRRGQVTELLERIARRDQDATKGLDLLMDAGESTREVLRTMFPTESSYNEFLGVLKTERNAARASAMVRRFLPYLVGGGAGYGVGSVVN